MTTQELKQYIDKVLGNNIRCLLPSYWWKKLFGEVVDNIDNISKSTKYSIDKLSTRVGEVEKNTSPLIDITYEDLCKKRVNEELIPGQSYRITDYECTINDKDPSLVVLPKDDPRYNKFCIVVTALTESQLSENASATLASNSYTYGFSNENSWELKYTLENNIIDYPWARVRNNSYDVVTSYEYNNNLNWGCFYWDSNDQKYVDEDSDGYIYLVNSLTDKTPLSNTVFNAGDTIYINRFGTVVETKVLYIDSMKDTGDGVVINCRPNYNYSTNYRPFIWDDAAQLYRSNTEDGYDILYPEYYTSNSNPIEKRESFYKNEKFTIRHRETEYLEFIHPSDYDIATLFSPNIEAYYLWSWSTDLNMYVLSNMLDTYLGTSDTDPTPLPKTEFSDGDTVYLYSSGKYVESSTVSFTKDSAISEDRICLGMKDLTVLCVAFDWDSELNAYYNEGVYQSPLVFKDGSFVNKDFDFSSNTSYGVITGNSEGPGSISTNGTAVGFFTPEGKGVIYYMKDHNNNEAFYDFKNILFKFPDIDENPRFTFHGTSSYNGVSMNSDHSEYNSANNKIGKSKNINKVSLCYTTKGVVVSGEISNVCFTSNFNYKYVGLNSKGEVTITNIHDIDLDAIESLKQEVLNNEEVTAAALIDLKDKIENLSFKDNTKDEANEIIAKSLNELNEKVETTEVVHVYLSPRHKFCCTDKKFPAGNAKVIIHGAKYKEFAAVDSFTDIPLNLMVDIYHSIVELNSEKLSISIPIVDRHYDNTQIKTYIELVLYNNNSFDAYIHETTTEFGDKLTIHYTKHDATVDQTADNALIDKVWEIE